MYVKNYDKVEEVNFLASAKFVPFTYQVEDTGVVVNKDGRKIVPAGTVYPKNDATALGILLNDVDVTEGPQPGSVLVEAWVIGERLPEVVSEEAKAAMKKITFKKMIG